MSSADQASDFILAWLATYLVHSTLLLCGCWLFFRWTKIRNHEITSRLWKFATLMDW